MPIPSPALAGTTDRPVCNSHWIFPHSTFLACEAELSRALVSPPPLVVLTGVSGVGKSTLSQRAVDRARSADARAASVVSTHLEPRELLRALAYGLGMDIELKDRRPGLSEAIMAFATVEAKQGRAALASIDEAHNLPDGSLIEILSLAHPTHQSPPKLHLLLAGNQELPLRVARLSNGLDTTFLELLVANREEVGDYLRARLAAISWDNAPQVTDEAIEQLKTITRGVPRHMNLLCTRLALHADLEERTILDPGDVEIVVEELQDESIFSASVPFAP